MGLQLFLLGPFSPLWQPILMVAFPRLVLHCGSSSATSLTPAGNGKRRARAGERSGPQPIHETRGESNPQEPYRILSTDSAAAPSSPPEVSRSLFFSSSDS